MVKRVILALCYRARAKVLFHGGASNGNISPDKCQRLKYNTNLGPYLPDLQFITVVYGFLSLLKDFAFGISLK